MLSVGKTYQQHFDICKETGIQLDIEHWYDHVPKVVTSHEGKLTALWYQQVQTNRTIPNNKLEVIICDNEKGTCMLIDVSISRDRNVIKNDDEKKPYIWNSVRVECKSKSNTTEVSGTISKSFSHYCSNIMGKHKIKEL